MAEIAKAYVTLIPSFKGNLGSEIKKNLESGSNPEQTGRSIGNKVGEGVKGGLSTLKVAAGSLLGNLATGAIDSIIGKVSELAGEAITASDATDKFRSTLDFAGIGTDQIESLTAACQKYADETVYDLSDIQSITAQLAANNVKDFDQLAEAAGNLNAVAGGNKDTFKSVGMVLTQTAGQGKLTTENFNQLADAIPGASGKIQEALLKAGAYTGNFRDAMAAGEITAEEFNQAILDLGFEDAAVEAATSASTMEGAMGNLEAAITGDLAAAFDTVKPMVTGAINFIAEGIAGLPDLFATVGDALGPFLSGLQEWFAPLASMFMETIVPALQMMVEKFLEFCDSVAPIVLPFFQGLGEVLQFVGGIIGEVFMVALELVINAVTALFDNLSGFFDWVSSTFGPFWTDTLLPFIQTAWEGIKTVVDGAVQFIQGLIDGFISVAGPIWDAFWEGCRVVVEGVWDAMQTVIETVMGVIQGIIDTVMGIITGDWDRAWSGIQQIFGSIWDGIKGLAENAIDFVKNIIDNGVNLIRNLWENCWNAVKDFVGRAWDGIKNGVSNGINGVIGFVRDLPGRILNALGNLGNLLVNAGRSIIDGFLRGLKSAWDGVCNFIGGIGSWIASHKGPLDYDRKLLIRNGEAIMEGLSSGLHGGFRGVMGDVSSMGSDIQKQVERSLHPISGAQLVSNIDISRAAQPMTADDLRSALGDMAGSGEIALYIDSKKVASTIASPMDAVLATRQSRLARTAI